MLGAAEKLQLVEIEKQVEIVPLQPRINPKDISECSGNIQAALRAFLCGSTKYNVKTNQYKIIGDELWFVRKSMRTTPTGRVKWNKDLVAKKIKGIYFGNSSKADAFYRNTWRGEPSIMELAIQRALARHVPMVPFSVFEDGGLNIENLKIIDKGPDEKLDLNQKDKNGKKIYRHFTGALLFSIEDKYYLFDTDRNDLKLKSFNAFMSRLPRACVSIEDAYASLKPKEVYEAERFMKEPCQRHGEWFFIPVTGTFKPGTGGARTQLGWGSDRKTVAVLQSKGNRPHYVDQLCDEGFVRGLVRHGGYEHKDIELKGWCKPVPNTAVESFKITGLVD